MKNKILFLLVILGSIRGFLKAEIYTTAYDGSIGYANYHLDLKENECSSENCRTELNKIGYNYVNPLDQNATQVKTSWSNNACYCEIIPYRTNANCEAYCKILPLDGNEKFYTGYDSKRQAKYDSGESWIWNLQSNGAGKKTGEFACDCPIKFDYAHSSGKDVSTCKGSGTSVIHFTEMGSKTIVSHTTSAQCN